jgi:8-oxo-dGTP pyrophosphatase MutT (NUDIX family)
VIDTALLDRIVRRLSAALAPPVGEMWPLVVDGRVVGALDPPRAMALARFADRFVVDAREVRFAPHFTDAASRTAAAASVARALADEGRLSAWRDEPYAVGSDPDGAPSFLLERAAARYFGIRTFAAHVNGTTRRDGGVAMWIARRSTRKAIDPGLLDNLVGGGVAAGASVASTVVKEAWEEAGLPSDLACTARTVGILEIRRAQPDGLQLETIFVHDLDLPPDVVPANRDGEVVGFRLETPDAIARLIATEEGPDVVTADASLVIADWLMRHGFVPNGTPAWNALDRLRGQAAPLARLRRGGGS